MSDNTKEPTTDTFDAYQAGMCFEAGVGLTIQHHNPRSPKAGGSSWLSWDETVKFSRWLHALVEADLADEPQP